MNNNEINHYGVPGMKWGVRKAKAMGGATKRQIRHPRYYKKARSKALLETKKTSTRLRRKYVYQTTAEIQQINKMVDNFAKSKTKIKDININSGKSKTQKFIRRI